MSMFGQIAQDITGIGAVVSAIGVAWAHVRLSWRKTEVDAELAYQNGKMEEIHQAVNSTAEAQNARVDQLQAALIAGNVDIPARPEPAP